MGVMGAGLEVGTGACGAGAGADCGLVVGTDAAGGSEVVAARLRERSGAGVGAVSCWLKLGVEAAVSLGAEAWGAALDGYRERVLAAGAGEGAEP